MRLNCKILLFVLFLFLAGCDSTEPPPEEKPEPIVKSITLSADKFTCTEVWLSVFSENLVLPRNAGIYRGDSLIEHISLNKPDTLLYYDDLLPAKDYTFTMTIPEDTVESNTAAFRTLDTTSHNFTYQTWEFGDFNSNILNDVTIVNENNIWAVGEIYLKDSLGNEDPKVYNAIYWNGISWKIRRISTEYRGNSVTAPLLSVYLFSLNDLWFSAGIPIHGDGQSWGLYHLYDMGVLAQDDGNLTKIWGTSTNNLFFVGILGSIVHYDGSQWQKVESGTTQMISDIWGLDENFILAAASHPYSLGDKKIIQINKNHSNDFNWEPQKRVSTVYFNNKYKLYAGGEGVWVFKNNNWKKVEGLPPFYVFRIRGSGHNDIWAVGGFGEVAHFNGSTWTTFDQLKLNTGNYYSVSVTKNRVCLVGYDGLRAVIKILKK